MDFLAQAKEARQKRGPLVKEAEDILLLSVNEKRAMTDEENTKWEKLHEESDSLLKTAEQFERQAEAQAKELEGREIKSGRTDNLDRAVEEEQRELEARAAAARRKFYTAESLTEEERALVGGVRPPSAEDMKVLEAVLDPETLATVKRMQASGSITFRLEDPPDLEQRQSKQDGRWNASNRSLYDQRVEARTAQSSGTAATGGSTVPNEAMAAIDQALLYEGGLRRSRATVLRTNSGATLPVPTSNDTGNDAVVLAENTQDSAQHIATSVVNLGAYKFTSKIIQASIEFMQDTSLNPDMWIAEAIGGRFARGTNTQYTQGDGSTEPQGIQWAATKGYTAAAAAAIAYADMVEMQHSVDPAYRARGAEWMFHDSTLKVIKKLVDGESRPLWAAGFAVREPDTILGHNYVINQAMSTVAATNHSVLFGDFSKYYIRDVRGIMILRLVERYADYAQVAFVGFFRTDGKLVNAGTAPIKYLLHPTS